MGKFKYIATTMYLFTAMVNVTAGMVYANESIYGKCVLCLIMGLVWAFLGVFNLYKYNKE